MGRTKILRKRFREEKKKVPKPKNSRF